jgi:biofilm PGA synthesis lipoprotein PgaB
LRRRVENFRKPVMLARNYYAEPILNPQAQTWFSQSLPDALRRFDWVAVMAMPYMEKAADANAWLDRLIQVITQREGSRAESDFRVAGQTLGARRARTLRGDRHWMRRLRIAGIRHFGYYPDDPFANHPEITTIRKELSVRGYAQ